MLDNPKRELFCQALIKNGGHKTEAYMEVYKAKYDTARHGGSFLLRNVEIRRRVSELLTSQGLGIVELNKKLKSLFEARKATFRNGDFSGFIPDNASQLEALKIAYRLHGLIGTDKEGGFENGVFIALNDEKIEQVKTTIIQEEEI